MRGFAWTEGTAQALFVYLSLSEEGLVASIWELKDSAPMSRRPYLLTSFLVRRVCPF